MTHEELKIRIRNMKQGGFLRMSPSNFGMLTDNFCEELVKYILVREETNERQRELIKIIKDKYGEWRKEIGDITWDRPLIGKRYPKYIDDFDFEIDCGNTIEEDSQMIGSWDAIPDNREFIDHFDEDRQELEKKIKEQKAQLEQVEAEKKQLEEELKVLQSPEGAPIDTEGHSAVRLELLRLLMDKDGADLEKHGNKVIAARMMEAITGLALKTCKNHLSDPNVNQTEHQEQIIEINSKLQALGMSIRL